MSTKTLEGKIKRLCLWALGLSFAYFVIGACLKSDGPNFDPAKTYDLLSDTLTLAAYFFTPAIACVLFTDWRDQHRRINNEKISNEIIDLLGKLVPYLNTRAITLMNNDDYMNYRKKYFGYLIDLKSKNKLINPNCEEASEFISKIDDVGDLLHNFWLKLETQIIIHHELDHLKDLGSEWNEMRQHYSKNVHLAQNENSLAFSSFMDIKNEIKILYV